MASLLSVEQSQCLGGGPITNAIGDNYGKLHYLFSLTPSSVKLTQPWSSSSSSRRGGHGLVKVQCSSTQWNSLPGLNSISSLVTTVDKKTKVTIKGTVVIIPKALLDLNDPVSTIVDGVSEFLGNSLTLQLVSTQIDPATGDGKRSPKSSLSKSTSWLLESAGIITNDEGTPFSVSFSVDNDFGTPGAFLMENKHPNHFFLKSLTLTMPDATTIDFNCNSWVYNTKNYPSPRIFFYNQPCFADDTPEGLLKLRDSELEQLRGSGNGQVGERQEADRIYDYDVYNDLGNPDRGTQYKRPVLGGSPDLPYPRRCRTGRDKTKSDPVSESPESLVAFNYVPRDERFGHIKRSDFVATSISSFAHVLIPVLEHVLGDDNNFESFDDVDRLYTKGIDLSILKDNSLIGSLVPDGLLTAFKPPLEIIQELKTSKDNPSLLKFPRPQVYQVDNEAWIQDEEFARQTLAGLNPMVIEQLKVFPPQSNLDPAEYGDLTSALTPEHIESNLAGLSAQQALEQKKLFIVDYHDAYLPYLTKINALKNKLAYASRSIFFLTEEGTLKPVAIELTLPSTSEQGGKFVKRVFTPPPSDQEEKDWIWILAKAHASVNDAGYHQLVSHWLKTHAVLEPFIIATHRQLSALHPLHVLLIPHFKDTMSINALARKSLINANTGLQDPAGAVIEKTFTPGKYCMEMSSVVYKSWRFDQEGLPADLLKRGMAEEDPSSPYGLKLLIEDFPYAVDGLETWHAINSWVRDYLSIYYKDDSDVLNDKELQKWWWEIRNVGHGDKKHEEWWVNMETIQHLRESLVTLIWIASAHHAAVNFGQYGYAGYMPNKPTLARKPIPDVGSPEHAKMQEDPEKFFFEAISTDLASVLVMATVQLLSTHANDEEYLGSRNTPIWTGHAQAIDALAKFKDKLVQIELGINNRNNDPKLKNRVGPVKVPYTLLAHSSPPGLAGKGIPNSISI